MNKVSSFLFKIKRNFSSSGFVMLNSYKCDYGQGGTLQMSLENRRYDLKLETFWEDYTEVETWKKPDQHDLYFLNKNEGLKNNIFHISDENYQSNIEELQESNKYLIKAKLPEYYSYKIRVNGSLEHLKGYVDAKTYGNVDINTSMNLKGEILLNKVKSEACSLQTMNGKITIKSSLDAKNADITTGEGDISIKKLGITGKSHIFSKKGNITIGSIYCTPQKNEKNAKQIELNDIGTEIHKLNFVSVNSIDSNISIGNIQGNLIVQCIQGNMDIKRCDGNMIMLENEKGAIRINLINLKENSLIQIKEKGQLSLNVSSEFEGNIYLVNKGMFWREENEKKGVPTLFIVGKITDTSICVSKNNDLLNYLKD